MSGIFATTGKKALTTGSSKELGLHSVTVNAVCEQYAKSRSHKKRPYWRYRGKKSLGSVPFKGRELKREGHAFRFAGNTFRVFHSRALPEGKIKHGSPIRGRKVSQTLEQGAGFVRTVAVRMIVM